MNLALIMKAQHNHHHRRHRQQHRRRRLRQHYYDDDCCMLRVVQVFMCVRVYEHTEAWMRSSLVCVGHGVYDVEKCRVYTALRDARASLGRNCLRSALLQTICKHDASARTRAMHARTQSIYLTRATSPTWGEHARLARALRV